MSNPTWSYAEDLATALRAEAERVGFAIPHDFDPLETTPWATWWHTYSSNARALAAHLSETSPIAQSYASMEDFWRDAEEITSGHSCSTYWDTYENGARRALEARLAEAYNAPTALLVNAGMSALAVAIFSSGMEPGATILTGLRGYFETTTLINTWLPSLGVKIIRADVSDRAAFLAIASKVRPDIILLETITNSPSAESLVCFGKLRAASQNSLLIVDNTVQSVLSRPIDFGDSPRAIVVESGTKFITNECSAGIIYGSHRAIRPCRDYARDTGQQLQQKAFNYLRQGEIHHLHDRMKLHSANCEMFLGLVSSQLPGWAISTLAKAFSNVPETLNEHKGTGGLIYLSPPDQSPRGEALCRDIVRHWRERASVHATRLEVRAGFGWAITSARSYQGAFLNQIDAPVFIRVSIGIEPANEIIRLAASFLDALRISCQDTENV